MPARDRPRSRRPSLGSAHGLRADHRSGCRSPWPSSCSGSAWTSRRPTSGGWASSRRRSLVALACQLVLLPAICFGLVVLFDLPPLLGIGLLLLAASPGGTTANLFSHLFRGDVALNITLTAINSIIAIATLPIITSLAINYFDRSDDVSMPFAEVVKVFALILDPGRDRHAGARPGARLRRTDGQAGPDRVGRHPGHPGARHHARPARQHPRLPRPTSAWRPASSARPASSSATSSRRPLGIIETQAIASSFEIGVHNGDAGHLRRRGGPRQRRDLGPGCGLRRR